MENRSTTINPLNHRRTAFKPGTVAYMIHSNRFIREVVIIRDEYGMCSVRFTDAEGGIRVRSSRLYSSKEEADQQLAKVKPKSFAFVD